MRTTGTATHSLASLRIVLLAITLAATALVALAPGPATAATGPSNDPFYTAPDTVADYAPGEVIASREVQARAYELPLPVRAWHLQYRTEDAHGRPSATLTTLLVPRSGWAGRGPRPLLSYQTAEDGVDVRCAPSWALTAGIKGGYTGSYGESGLIAAALARGWAVTVPDYEGPNSEFLVADTEAKGVLDAIRASQGFLPELAHSPVGLWGYSGGSFASANAAQLQPTYAPELDFAGIALGGLLGDVRATIDAFDGSIAGGAIPMGINGFLRAYPELDLLQYLSPSGREKVAATAGDCIFDAASRWPFLRVADIEARPGAFDEPPIAAMLAANSPRHRPGAPSAPVYHYHAILDEFAPLGPANDVLRNYCAAGTPVQSRLSLVGEHLTEIVLGAPGALAFLADRFAGKPATNHCTRRLL